MSIAGVSVSRNESKYQVPIRYSVEPGGEAEVAAARETLGWTAEPFEIPTDIYADWNATGERGKALRAEWHDRLKPNGRAAEFSARMAGQFARSAARLTSA